ncbi:MAG: hypothetical protein P4L49_13235 [Desulfosporosinus sp.]|nr:hypothetical protein [Desulfosporosinus sp.]
MLKVVFRDSAKGAMKMAKNYNKENMLSGAMGYIGKKSQSVAIFRKP